VRSLTTHSTLTTTSYYNRLDGVWGMFVSPTDLLKFKLSSNFYGVQSNYHLSLNKLTLNVGAHANSYNRFHSGSIDTLSLYTNTGYKVDYSGYTKVGYTIGKFNLFGDLQLRNVEFKYVGDTTISPLTWIFFTPEQVIDYELGSNININRLSMQYDFYFMNFKNEITLLGALGSNGLPLMTNVSKSYRSGFELDLNYRLTDNLSLTNSSNVSYCRIKGDGKEFQPLYTPNLILNQGIEYKYKRFNFAILGKYHSKSFINSDNTLTTPQFLLVNANIGYTYKQYSILIQGVNITNQQYYTSGYGVGAEKYLYVNAPLSGYVTIKAIF